MGNVVLHEVGRKKAEDGENDPGDYVVNEKAVDSNQEGLGLESNNCDDDLDGSWSRKWPAKIENFFVLSFTEPFMMEDHAIMGIGEMRLLVSSIHEGQVVYSSVDLGVGGGLFGKR